MFRKTYLKNAFTLIEILVVLVILSILSIFVITSTLNSSRSKARDTQRKYDLKGYQTALASFGLSNQQNYFPSFTTRVPLVTAVCPYLFDYRVCRDDPDTAKHYYYISDGAGGGSISASNYVIWSKLERSEGYWVACSNGSIGYADASFDTESEKCPTLSEEVPSSGGDGGGEVPPGETSTPTPQPSSSSTPRPTGTPAVTTSPTPTPTVTPTPTPALPGSLPWGAMYSPVDQAIGFGLQGIITANHSGAAALLSSAREHGIRVIVTLGTTAECNYYSAPTVFNYNQATTDFNNYLNQFTGQFSSPTLASFVQDGTLAAIRIFDEVDYAGSCGSTNGIMYTYGHCLTGTTPTTNTQRGLPIGSDSEPGYADLLHYVIKRLPGGLAVGSTTSPGYMILIADRINLLRQREGLSALGSNNILAYSGYQCRQGSPSAGCPHYYAPSKDHFQCMANLSGSGVIFYLANRSANYETDNYLWWDDYMGACQAQGVDFVTAWSWTSGNPNFQSRIESLAAGQVTSGGQTISLQDVQNTCRNKP